MLRKGEHLLLLQKQLKQLEHKKELSAVILESKKGQDDQEARENFNQIRKELKSIRNVMILLLLLFQRRGDVQSHCHNIIYDRGNR